MLSTRSHASAPCRLRAQGFLLDHGFQIFLSSYPEAMAVLDYEKLDLKPFYAGALVFWNGGLHRVSDPFRRGRWGAPSPASLRAARCEQSPGLAAAEGGCAEQLEPARRFRFDTPRLLPAGTRWTPS